MVADEVFRKTFNKLGNVMVELGDLRHVKVIESELTDIVGKFPIVYATVVLFY